MIRIQYFIEKQNEEQQAASAAVAQEKHIEARNTESVASSDNRKETRCKAPFEGAEAA